MNVTAIIEDGGSINLIDSGLRGNGEGIINYLSEFAKDPLNIKDIVVTHFDSDHMGSVAEIQARTGCSIFAHQFDAAIMEGKRFGTDELMQTLPGYSQEEIEALEGKISERNLPDVKVNKTLKGGEKFEFAGGAEVFHTPGHTPGHMVVFLPKFRALVTGDALTVVDGRVGPPRSEYTVSPRKAIESLRRLAGINFDVLVPYHSKILRSGGSEELRRYIATIN